MKVLLIAWQMAFTAMGLFTLVAAEKAEHFRVCPDGFFYAGEDIQPSSFMRGYWLEEIGRSPTYSCYRLDRAENGISEAIGKCDLHHSRLLTFEHKLEVQHVFTAMSTMLISRNITNITFATSGMYFDDIKSWVWLGTMNTTANPVPGDVVAIGTCEEQCLGINGEQDGQSGEWNISFIPIRCNDPLHYVCEVRTQTVTFHAWFYSNWLTLLLSLMIVLLMVTLCVSAFRSNSGARLYRDGHQSSRPQIVRVHGPPAVLDNDGLPSYKDVARKQSPGDRRMEKYRDKSKEVLAKMTFHKGTTP